MPGVAGARSVQVTLAFDHCAFEASEAIPVTFTNERFRPLASGRFASHSVCVAPSGPVIAGGAATRKPALGAGRARFRCGASTRATPTTGPAPPVTRTVTSKVGARRHRGRRLEHDRRGAVERLELLDERRALRLGERGVALLPGADQRVVLVLREALRRETLPRPASSSSVSDEWQLAQKGATSVW